MFFSKECVDTIIARGTESKGDIVSRGIVRVEGVLIGNVRARRLELARGAKITGWVCSGSVEVAGTVEGDILKSGAVSVFGSGYIRGDVEAQSLTLHDGGFIDGRLKRSRPAPDEQDSPATRHKVAVASTG